MSFGSRLRERREALGMKQSELGRLLGVTGSAIGNYENSVSSPKAEVLYRAFDVLQCDANYLFQDEMRSTPADSVSPVEFDMLRKYRALDRHGKALVDTVLDMERGRVTASVPAAAPRTRIIPLLGNSFAAGVGEPDFGNALEEYEVSADVRADFAVRVNGDSMEPWLPDGSVALGVKGVPQDGDVAALIVDGAFYVKQVCIDALGNLYLFSLNRARADLDLEVKASAGAHVSCFGTIVMRKRLPLPLR